MAHRSFPWNVEGDLADQTDMFGGPTWSWAPTFSLPGRLPELRAGLTCPSCTHHVQVYRRKLAHPQIRLAVWLHQAHERQARWYHRTEFPIIQGVKGGGDYGKLRFWFLIEPRPKAKGEPSSGYWRPTEYLRRFLYGSIRVPASVIEFMSTVYVHETPMVYAWEVMGLRHFDWQRLMRGEGDYFSREA